jgi:peptidoglycan hydrolase-like protein with peptidoglycan-binding domain
MTAICVVTFLGARYASAEIYNNDLTIGSSGAEVETLQTWLESNGYLKMPSGVSKGYFGQITRSALAEYQKSIGFPAYGFFGPMSREHFNRGRGSVNSLNVISPNGGETWQKGTNQTIRWNSPQYFRATTVDVGLMEYKDCSRVCTPSLPRQYDIVKNISANSNSYSWRVGEYYTGDYSNIKSFALIPNGQYIIQICESGTSVCTSSKRPFAITSQVVDNRAPVINSFSAPTILTVGQTGTWTINATDPQNSSLSYSVTWEDVATVISSISPSSSTFTQSTSFTHSYSNPGTYTVRVSVRNSAGLTTQSSATVQVTSNGQTNNVRVTSPNGGETLKKGDYASIRWNPGNLSGAVTISLIAKSNCVLSPCLAPPLPDYTGVMPDVSTYIVKNISNTGTYSWKVGEYNYSGTTLNAPNGDYKISVCVGSICDTSDSYFTITDGQVVGQTVKVVSPNGGENWVANSVHQIMWTNTNSTYNSKVDLYLLPIVACPMIYPAPASCYPAPITLDKDINSNSVYNWIVATDIVNNKIPSGMYIVKICRAGSTDCDSGDNSFNIN